MADGSTGTFVSSLASPPSGSDSLWAPGYTYEEARAAVEDHERGSFALSAQLAQQAIRYPPIKAAADQRRAVPEGMPWIVPGPERAPGRRETEAATAAWEAHGERLIGSILDDIAGMGFSVVQIATEVDADGYRRVTRAERWALGAVWWTEQELSTVGPGGAQVKVRGYYARDADGAHYQLPRAGETDGQWIVFGAGDRPHIRGAVRCTDLQYVAGQILERSRANLGTTMGRASPVVELPEGVQSRDATGAETPELRAAKDVVIGLGTKRAGAVLVGGAKVNKFELGSSTHDFFASALVDRIQMIELAWLGRAGTLVKPDDQYQAASGIEMSVPEDLVRADVRHIERGWSSLFALLGRLNADLPPAKAPRLKGLMPDTDQAERVKAEQEQRARDDAHREAQLKAAGLAAAQVAAERAAGLVVDAARVASIYAIAGVDPPALPPPAAPALPPGASAAGEAPPAASPLSPAQAPP